jgi:epoxyqueuosine reductase
MGAMYFANSNIDTEEEWERRLEAAKLLAAVEGVPLFVEPYDHEEWLREVAAGYEKEPEKGARCARCFRYNIAKAVKFAAENGFDAVTSSLTLSPHKVSAAVFEAGEEAADGTGVAFLEYNFKKKDGFLMSLKRTKELGLYRQAYCGCEFSKHAR